MYLPVDHLSFFILCTSLTILPASSLNPQDIERLSQQHRRLDVQHQLPYSARPTQFVPSSQVSSTAYARGALIMPANNPIQATSSFYSASNQRHHEPANNALLTGLESTQGKATTGQLTSRGFNSSQRMETGGIRGLSTSSLELALRQASTDESVFQPSPMIGAPEPSFEWQPQVSTFSTDSDIHSQKQQQQHQESVVGVTTEQNNNIAQNEPIPSIRYSPTDPQISGFSANEHMSGVSSSSFSVGSSSNSTAGNNEQVVYEGPATAPPTNDYYFSSAERHPNREKTSNVWWALGAGQEYERVSNLTTDDYLDYCSNSEFLNSMALEHPSKVQVFGEVMKQPNRERSFLNAIFAAGLAHAMTKACSQNELPEECSCDKKIRTKSNKGIEWVACSDDIDFGARFSRDFTDNTDNESDTTAMINTHNYEVGRRVFKSATDITCTCSNGENGLCKTKRCWKHLGSFKDIGEELMRRYESATHVQLSSKDPHKLRPVKRGVRRPKRKDLVYIDESPDYCNAHVRIGVLGTHNRRCNSTSLGSDSCSLLCCGRGYQVIVEEIEEDCNCKFVWCCQVKCDKCKRHITSDVCN